MNFLNRVISARRRLAAVGVPLVLLGISGFYLHSRAEPHLVAHQHVDFRILHEVTLKLREPAVAKISVDCPSAIYLNDSADVRVSVALTGLQGRPKKHTLMFLLSGAGLEVQPADWLEVEANSPGGAASTALWSVSAKQPGLYHLVLNTKQPTDPKGQTSLPPLPLELTFEKSPELVLHVQRRWTDYVAEYWPAFSTFMGSLLTLPGLIAFFRKSGAKPGQDTDGPTE